METNKPPQRTHENYIVSFTDGTVKIGTTRRGTKRIDEVVKEKRKNNNIYVVSYYLSNIRTKEDAFRAERDTCYLMRRRALENTREWLKSNSLDSSDIRDFADYVKQTLDLFASGIGLKRSSKNEL